MIAMRGQLSRERFVKGTYVESRRPEAEGGSALEGRRVHRATTHPVEVMVLTGRPERLEVMATRRAVFLVAGHEPIEADTAPGQDPPLTAWTLPFTAWTLPWREVDARTLSRGQPRVTEAARPAYGTPAVRRPSRDSPRRSRSASAGRRSRSAAGPGTGLGPGPGPALPVLRLALDAETPVDLHAPTMARATDNATDSTRVNAEGAHRHGGRPSRECGVDQTWPAFSRAEQHVSTMRRVTRYGSTLAFGRRSSM